MRVAAWVVGVLLAGVLLYYTALPGDLPAAVDTTTGLVGTYTTNGVHPDGSEFGGTAIITERDGVDRYDLQLIITGSILAADLRVEGDEFVFDWRTLEAADTTPTGTGVFTADPDGNLSGTWRVDGYDGVGTMELFVDP